MTMPIRFVLGVTSSGRPRLKTIWPNGKIRSRFLPMPTLKALVEDAIAPEEQQRLVQVYARGLADGRRRARRARGHLLAALVYEGASLAHLQNALDQSAAIEESNRRRGRDW